MAREQSFLAMIWLSTTIVLSSSTTQINHSPTADDPTTRCNNDADCGSPPNSENKCMRVPLNVPRFVPTPFSWSGQISQILILCGRRCLLFIFIFLVGSWNSLSFFTFQCWLILRQATNFSGSPVHATITWITVLSCK